MRFSRPSSWLVGPAVIAALALTAVPAQGQQLIVNGGFETGDLTGWSISGITPSSTCPIDNQDWNVGTSGSATGCSDPGSPYAGTYAAYNMFDGTGPLTYTMSQSFVVPGGLQTATLGFFYSAVWFVNGAPRTFSVDLYGTSGLLGNVFSLSASSSGSTTGGWQGSSSDVSSLLAGLGGQSVELRFSSIIPETWTGPAGLGVDNVSLQATVVPEPATMTLLATGLAGMAAARRRRKKA